MAEESLGQRQKNFIFSQKSVFVPVARHEIHGVDYLLKQIDPYILLLRETNPGQENTPYIGHILFSGASGTGKTYMARYIAGSAKAHFINANEFPRRDPAAGWLQEDIVSLWTLCREYIQERKSYVIMFFDQFEEFWDSASRNGATSQFYSELDGLTGKPSGIVVIAATTHNYKSFDAQLLRPGRLSACLQFEPPTKHGMTEVLLFYLSHKLHDPIDVDDLVELSGSRMTPADIADLVNLAYFNALMRTQLETVQLQQNQTFQPIIAKVDFISAIITTTLGRPGADIAEISPETVFAKAVRQAGYAIVARKLGRAIKYMSVVPIVGNMGKTRAGIETASVSGARDEMVMAFGSYVAEQMVGLKSQFPFGDLNHVTKLAYSLVTEMGQGKRVRRQYGCWVKADNNYKNSENLQTLIEADVADWLKIAYRRSRIILKKVGAKNIEDLSLLLQNKQILFGEELEEYLQNREIAPGKDKKISQYWF